MLKIKICSISTIIIILLLSTYTLKTESLLYLSSNTELSHHIRETASKALYLKICILNKQFIEKHIIKNIDDFNYLEYKYAIKLIGVSRLKI